MQMTGMVSAIEGMPHGTGNVVTGNTSPEIGRTKRTKAFAFAA